MDVDLRVGMCSPARDRVGADCAATGQQTVVLTIVFQGFETEVPRHEIIVSPSGITRHVPFDRAKTTMQLGPLRHGPVWQGPVW